MSLLKCQAGLTSGCCSLSSMASSGLHFRLIPLLSSERSSRANIFPTTLNTRAVSLKGKPSVTPGLAWQYSLISSRSKVTELYLQVKTFDISLDCLIRM